VSGVEKGGRLVQSTCLEDGRALGKKESEHAMSRSKTSKIMLLRDRRVSVSKLVWLESGGKVGGMEIDAKK